jgi:TPR repeat protein
MWRKAVSIAILMSLLDLTAAAGPLEDVNAAVKKRDYVTAVRIVRPLADRGDANAQYMLGMFYDNGLGVPQDRVRGYMWLSLAASQGRENAAIIRDLSAQVMTAAQINEAKRLVDQWRPVANRR